MKMKYLSIAVISGIIFTVYFTLEPENNSKNNPQEISSREDKDFHNHAKKNTLGGSDYFTDSNTANEIIEEHREPTNEVVENNDEATLDSPADDKISSKVVHYSNSSENAYLDPSVAKNLDDTEFNKLLTELSNAYTERSAEYRYKYNLEILNSLSGSNITIGALECNDIICAASIDYEYSTLDEVEEKLNNANLDTSSIIFTGTHNQSGTRVANVIMSAGRSITGLRFPKESSQSVR